MLKSITKSGFAMIEVIMAAGILTLISLGMVGMMSDMYRAQRGAKGTDVMRDFAVDIRSILSDKTACLNTFNGSNLTTGTAEVTTVKDKTGAEKFHAGAKYMGGLLSFNKLSLRDYVANGGTPNIGKAKLFIYADKTGDVAGPQSTYHVLSMQIEMNAAKDIIKCVAVGGLSDSLWQVSTVNSDNIFYQGGRIGIGTDDPQSMIVVQSDGAVLPLTPGFASRHFGTGAEANGLFTTTARGTSAAPTAIQNGDRFFSIIGSPYNGTFYHNSAGIQFYATENHSPAGQGAAITFETIANGTPVAAGVTSRVERMRIDHNGNVGIGTTSPAHTLHISGNSSGFGNQTGAQIGDVGTGNGPLFLIHNSPEIGGNVYYDSGSKYGGGMGKPALIDLAFGIKFYTSNNPVGAAGTPVADLTERMIIGSNGNVGIGTSTPTEKLEVNGNIKAANLWKCLCNGQKAYMFGFDGNVDALYGSMIYYEDISGNDCWVAADRPSPGHYTLVCTKL